MNGHNFIAARRWLARVIAMGAAALLVTLTSFWYAGHFSSAGSAIFPHILARAERGGPARSFTCIRSILTTLATANRSRMVTSMSGVSPTSGVSPICARRIFRDHVDILLLTEHRAYLAAMEFNALLNLRDGDSAIWQDGSNVGSIVDRQAIRCASFRERRTTSWLSA